MATFRTFIAFETPEEIKAEMLKVQQKLKETNADFRWESPTKFHATMTFLGDTDESTIPVLRERIEGITRRIAPFPVTYENLGAFPGMKHPRVIWIGCHNEDGTLESLKTALDRELTGLGFEIERRSFRPHVTMGRVKSDKGIQHLLSRMESLTFEPRTATIGGIVLMKSVLSPQGAEYSLLCSFQFHPKPSTEHDTE